MLKVLAPRVENTGRKYREPDEKGLATESIIGDGKTNALIDCIVFLPAITGLG